MTAGDGGWLRRSGLGALADGAKTAAVFDRMLMWVGGTGARAGVVGAEDGASVGAAVGE